ncbi:hypothetical protein CDL12_29720 [Handroanthus impetiginosus]|uniref:Uncharacterized protein n=1 Tax=Handroanthus impetiginosus TaxID=429701 RepID=A0A2G9FXL6_9LAMI|nr:hypothetical protein CDL12_29720 [Handroanthus impetiginosus]
MQRIFNIQTKKHSILGFTCLHIPIFIKDEQPAPYTQMFQPCFFFSCNLLDLNLMFSRTSEICGIFPLGAFLLGSETPLILILKVFFLFPNKSSFIKP